MEQAFSTYLHPLRFSALSAYPALRFFALFRLFVVCRFAPSVEAQALLPAGGILPAMAEQRPVREKRRVFPIIPLRLSF